MLGAGQHFDRHIVATDRGDVLAGQPLRGADLDAGLAGDVAVIVRHEEAAPTCVDAEYVSRPQSDIGGVERAFQIVARHRAAGFQIVVAVQSRDIDADAARDDRGRVLYAQIFQPPIADFVPGAAAAIHVVALGKMAQRVDMGADMGRHFDAFQVGACVVLRPQRASSLDAVRRGRGRGDDVGQLHRLDFRRPHLDDVAEVVDAALPDRAERGQCGLRRQQVPCPQLIARTPARMVVNAVRHRMSFQGGGLR